MKLFASLIVSALLLQTAAYGAVVYGLTSPFDADSGTYSPTRLFEFSLNGNSFVDRGQILLNGAPDDFDGLAAGQGVGLLAFLNTPAGSRLVQIDATSLNATILAPPLFGREIRGATMTDTGVLWAVDSSSDELVRVSSNTGEEVEAITLKHNALPFDVPQAVDLAVDFSGQLLLVAARDIYAVNLTTGDMTALFTDTQGESTPASSTPPNSVGAVVGFSGAEKLFTFDVEGAFADDLYTYNLSNSFSRDLFLAAPIPQIDAGLGDLALLVQPVDSGDYNDDGVVNAADYTLWRDSYGSTSQFAANGVDTGTSMSLINVADYNYWFSRFGNMVNMASGKGSVTTIPEPNSMLLILCTLMIFTGPHLISAARRRLRGFG